MTEKFEFPKAGIHLVAHKVGEADYFLEKLKVCHPLKSNNEFLYLFSAFVSAVRSVTFSLQYVMRKYPGFDNWYKPWQDKLRQSDLAKAFVLFRNLAQKTAIVPIAASGSMFEGVFYNETQFFAPENSELKEVPAGEVIELSEKCLIEVLKVVGECYQHFDIYINPDVLFTERALATLNWEIEDLEEFIGFPRGWTNMDFGDEELSNREIRLKLLRPYGGDETLQVYLNKYLN